MALRAVGDVLASKYRIEALLGTGGMGDVYRATNILLNREVAIKLLHLKHAADADLLERFMREARVANVVRHPNVVDVLDIDKDADGSPFIVQELLFGEDLSHYAKAHGRLTLDEIRTLVLPIVEAVAEAHSHGVIHRDIKPANVFLASQHVTLDGPVSSSVRRAPRSGVRVVPKLLDFGISKLRSADIRATDVGVLLGTPAYMAPEVLHGVRDADARTDVWALGVMLFELLAGRRPFLATGPNVFVEIATTDAPPLADVAPEIDRDVCEVVDRCLRRDVTQRFASANELATALANALHAASDRAPTALFVEPGAAPAEPMVPDLDLPGVTLAGTDPTIVDPVAARVDSTLPSPQAPAPERTEVMANAPRSQAAPMSMRPPRSSGLSLDEAPPSSRRPSSEQWAPRTSIAAAPPMPRQAESPEFPWLVSLLVLGLAALGVTGALSATLRQPAGFAFVRLLDPSSAYASAQLTTGVQVGAALAAGALGAFAFRSSMRQWKTGGPLPALVTAAVSGGLLFATFELLRAAW
jgi:eukaryotic-like serine/threonine-protein kinase